MTRFSFSVIVLRCWRPGDDPLEGGVEVLVANQLLLGASREDGRLVAEVGQVGAGEPGGLAREPARSTSSASGLPRVCTPRIASRPARSGGADEDLPVEAPGAEQGGVEILEPVRGGDDDDLGRGR